MSTQRVVDRFTGRILGAGSSSGLRFVVGDWQHSPLGAFTDVMIATAQGRRILVAPDQGVVDYVTATYTFDEVVLAPVQLHETGGGSRWHLEAGSLTVDLSIGLRTRTGWLLRAVPRPVARSRTFATIVDPIARLVHPGVRTRGSAGNGRREYYGAHDQHAVTRISGHWQGSDLGDVAPVTPAPRFGFSSTPARPSLTRVTTTIVRTV